MPNYLPSSLTSQISPPCQYGTVTEYEYLGTVYMDPAAVHVSRLKRTCYANFLEEKKLFQTPQLGAKKRTRGAGRRTGDWSLDYSPPAKLERGLSGWTGWRPPLPPLFASCIMMLRVCLASRVGRLRKANQPGSTCTHSLLCMWGDFEHFETASLSNCAANLKASCTALGWRQPQAPRCSVGVTIRWF